MLSIEITDRHIKLIRGNYGGNKVRVQEAHIRTLTPELVSNGFISDVPLVAAEITDIITQAGIKEKETIASVTSSSVIHKEIVLPKPKSLKNTLALESMIRSNMNLNADYSIAYTISGETQDEQKNTLIRISASACPQRLVDGYVRLFNHLGMPLKGVFLTNSSITKLVTNTPKLVQRMPFLLCQVDQDFLNVNLYSDQQLIFSSYFKINPNEDEDVSTYVNRAVYENLFRMTQFIKNRNDIKPIKEIMFYGDIGDFISLSNNLSSLNIPTHVLNAPVNVIPSCELDFAKFANVIGALIKKDNIYEHLNLLDTSKAKETKGVNSFLLILGASLLASGLVVFGVVQFLNMTNKRIEDKIKVIEAAKQDPVLMKNIEVVNQREQIKIGFEEYKTQVKTANVLFEYMPKFDSNLFNKIEEPFEDIISEENKNLKDFKNVKGKYIFTSSVKLSGYDVEAKFYAYSDNKPSEIPSEYVENIIKVMNKNGMPYFTNVVYEGFSKVDTESDSNDQSAINRVEDDKGYWVEFTIKMTLNPGNDENEEHGVYTLDEFEKVYEEYAGSVAAVEGGETNEN